MTFWAFSSLVNLVTSFSLGTIILYKNPKDIKNITFGFFCFATVVWSFSYYIWQISKGHDAALFWVRVLMAGAIFIPICYFHHLIALVDKISKYRNFIKSIYVFGFLSLLADFTPYFVKDVSSKLMFLDWPIPGILFYPFVTIWFFLCIYETYFIYDNLKISNGVNKEQLKYVFIGTVIGWVGAFTNYPLWFNVPIPPVGNIFVSIYLLIVAYAIVKFRLMNVRLAFSNTAIFIIVYALVLGIPFYFGYVYNQWQFSTWTMLVLATGGPFILQYLQKKAADKILNDERRYQVTILRAADGLTKYKTRKSITRLIAKLIYGAMGVKTIAIYLKQEGGYRLTNKLGQFEKLIEEIPVNRLLDEALIDLGIFFTNEINYQKHPILGFLKEYPNFMVVPVTFDKQLLAIVVIGEKKNNSFFSDIDLNTLKALAPNTGMALENAKSQEEKLERLKKEDALQRREDIDAIMAVMAHEIRTPNGSVIMQAETLLMEIENSTDLKGASFAQGAIKKLNIILKSAETTDILIDRIKRFTQEHCFEIVSIDLLSLLDNTEFLWQAILKKYPGVTLIKNLADSLPKVLGDEIIVEQIILNYISNAAHAVANCKNENKTIVLNISKLDEKYVRIEVVDNGYGIPPQVLKKLFYTPTTTKINKDGSGLGLWNIHRMSERINGYVGINSEGEGKGARVWLDLKIAL
jgi:signal transduction histidine kinase